MARRAPAVQARNAACVLAALLLVAGAANAQQSAAASAPATSAASAAVPTGAASLAAPAPQAPAAGPGASAAAPMGSATPASSGPASASAPNANDQPLAKPDDSSMTAVSAQFLLVGPDAWPFESDRQAKFIAALQADLGFLATATTGKPFAMVVTDVRSSSGSSAPPGRKLLQALNSLVTVQIDTGSINLVESVRTNVVSDTQSGNVLTQCQQQGLSLTSVSLASATYSTPIKPLPDTRPQLAAGIAVAGCIVFAFVGWMIYLESEKTRSCCGYSWGTKPGAGGKPTPVSKPAGARGLRGMFSKTETVAAGETNGVPTAKYNFDDPREVAMQPASAAAAAPAAGIGRHRLP